MGSILEEKFITLWDLHYPSVMLSREVEGIPGRRFRFDFAHLPTKTVIEINGGNYIGGIHSRAECLGSEYEKINLAQLNGYQVFILDGNMITIEWLSKIYDHILLKPAAQFDWIPTIHKVKSPKKTTPKSPKKRSKSRKKTSSKKKPTPLAKDTFKFAQSKSKSPTIPSDVD